MIPAGFGAAALAAASPPRVRLLVDPSNPVAAPLVRGLLQKAAASAQPKAFARRGLALFEKYAGAMAPELVAVEEHDLLGGGADDQRSMVAFFAAGLGVMFLLFSASAAGGALLEEVEAGTLDRLLSSRLGMGRLLVGKWMFITFMGVLQLVVMFTWGRIAFGLDLFSHLPGFLAMTLATAGAAAGFGLVLATACRSRGQLSGIGTIVILMMSSLGGSMFPRFLMSEKVQKLGLLTFNGWALDGYIKVFWRNAPLVELWPQLLALVLIGAGFMAVARRLARRWETA